MSGTAEEPNNGTHGTPLNNVEPATGSIFERFVGISEAIAISRAGKSQISRDSNTNKLPYILNDKKQKRYKVADLYDLYGFREQNKNSSKEEMELQGTRIGTPDLAIENAVLKSELKAKEDAMRRVEEEVRDLRQTRDRLLDQNNRLTMLLPAPAPQPTPEPATSNPLPSRSWFRRLFP